MATKRWLPPALLGLLLAVAGAACLWLATGGGRWTAGIMALAVVPFGVLAAIYLREYAKQGALVRAVRISVNNLAGVHDRHVVSHFGDDAQIVGDQNDAHAHVLL